MFSIDVAQISAGFDDVADASFEFLGFGETAVCFAIPQYGCGDGWRGGGGGRGLMEDFYDEGSSCGGLEGNLAQTCGECGKEFLGVLDGGWGDLACVSIKVHMRWI